MKSPPAPFLLCVTTLIYITHPDVVRDPAVPVPQWALSARGRARMNALFADPWISAITRLYSSEERKALDGAAILSERLGVPAVAIAALGEIDRSSIGFVTDDEYAALMRACFAQPAVSASGWETAAHAQQRVATAVRDLLDGAALEDVVAIVGHGTVGTLLLCHLTGRPISLSERPKGTDGGSTFIYDMAAGELVRGWERFG